MRKKILLPLLMMCIGSFVLAVSCEKTKDTQPVAEITLSQETVQLDIYQEFLLTAQYKGSEKLVWTVADPTVASVENGKLIALKEGTTTVTVKAGSVTDTCTLTVSPLNETKLSLSVAQPNVTLYKNDQKQIAATVLYGGKAIETAVEKSYQSSNSDVVSVDASGKMTAKEFGCATVSVIYTLGGAEAATSVNVEVVSSGLVEIAQSSVTLALSDENNTATLTAKAYEKGVESTDASIVWSVTGAQDVIQMTNGAIKAINAGETTVTATYVDQDGVTKTDAIAVTVVPTINNVNKTVELWKNEYTDGYPIDELELGETDEITGGYVVLDGKLTTALSFADGKYDVSTLSLGEMELYVQTRNTTYQIALTVFEKVYLDNSNFEARLANLSGSASAEFILTEDITLDGTWTNAFVFAGSLDGQGHTVSGLKLSKRGGLFKAMENATVKDLALVGVTLGSGAGAFAYMNNTGETVFENVYVSLSSNSEKGKLAGLIADNSISKNSKITAKNCVVYIPDDLTAASAFVTGATATNNTVTVENCTFVGANGKIVGDDANVVNTSSLVCGVLDAHKTYKVNWLEMQVKAYEQDYKYAELTNANFATYMNVAGTITGHYELAEDIVLNNTYYGKSNTFKGTLDGKGHTISGINAASGGGLFKTLNGTVKNVTLKGQTSGKAGVLAYTTPKNGGFTLENVYIEAAFMYSAAAGNMSQQGAIATVVAAGTKITLNNVVVQVTDYTTDTAGTCGGALFGYATYSTATTITMTNCYYIAATGITALRTYAASNTTKYYSANNQEALLGEATPNADGTVTTFANGLTGYTGETVGAAKDAFDKAVKATLSEELQTMMYPTAN